jgi:prophage antirepressor-like protein
MQTVFFCDQAGEATVVQNFQAAFGDDHVAKLSAVVAEDGEPWFRGTEAAMALGYMNPQRAIRDHVDVEDRGILENFKVTETVTLLRGNEGAAVYISESGLYSLILRSKLPYAKAFQRWVLKEVLPSIRKTGNYTQPAKEPAITDAQKWDTRRALLEALKSSHSLAQIAGIQLGDGHRKAMENAINEVLLPPSQQQEHMIDAAELLRRKGHSPAEIARLAGELGKALKTTCEWTGRGSTMNHHEFGSSGGDVRMYHAHEDANLLEAVYRNFQRRDLFHRVCPDHGSDLTMSVEEALLNGRGTIHTPRVSRGRGAGRGR